MIIKSMHKRTNGLDGVMQKVLMIIQVSIVPMVTLDFLYMWMYGVTIYVYCTFTVNLLLIDGGDVFHFRDLLNALVLLCWLLHLICCQKYNIM